MRTIEEILRNREARAIKYMSIARICLSALGITLTLPDYGLQYDLSTLRVLWLLTILVNAGFIWYLQRETHLHVVGIIGVAFDLFFLVYLPVIWYQWTGGNVSYAVFLMKFPIPIMWFITVTISCLAMRPLYPATATLGMALHQSVFLNLGFRDQRTLTSRDFTEVFLGPTVSPSSSLLLLSLFWYREAH